MTEANITCPKCGELIPVTASLAAPIVDAARREFEKKAAAKDAEFAERELAIKAKVSSMEESQKDFDRRLADSVAASMAVELERIQAEERTNAVKLVAEEVDQKTRELSELQSTLVDRDKKLKEAQDAQADLLKQKREFEDAKRELELSVEKKVQDQLSSVRQKATKEAEDSLNLRVREKDQTIASMQQTIAELKRKSEQGSQQLQGEVLELEIENMLRRKFPFDTIEPIAKGEHGGDLLQIVNLPNGQRTGCILWETKRTKNWSDGWLSKLREDQRSAKAEIAVMVSQSLPKGIDTFGSVDGVWITSPHCAIPVAMSLRETLVQVANTRLASVGQQTKTEMVYQYLTGPQFKQRVEAIVEAFTSMQSDLDRERKVIMKQWAKREEQINRVVGATVGMWGDFQGIVGRSLHDIEGLEFEGLLEDQSIQIVLPEN